MTKAGIISLTRTLAQRLPETHNIRVNGICPSLTRTPLAAKAANNILPLWEDAKLPVNEPSDVATVAMSLICDSISNRKVLWVEGAKVWDFEEPLFNLLPQWISNGPSQSLKAFHHFLNELTLSKLPNNTD